MDIWCSFRCWARKEDVSGQKRKDRGVHVLGNPFGADVNRQDAIEILRRNQDALRARGIRHAALFGSVARGEAHGTSDVDVLIELDPAMKLDMFVYAGLKRFVAELFEGPVDVVNKDALKTHLRRSVAADAIYAF